jgi:radical SAM superfamily enzyme YgiQ (UPF0313 family)
MTQLLLINPKSQYKGLGNYRTTSYPLLNLPYVAALTPDHYEITVIDENIKPFEFQKADIVGITAFTSTVNRAYEIAQIYRKAGIPVVMGGIHVSMMPQEALSYCDTVVIGEAEGAWPRVIEDFEAGKMRRQYRGTWIDLAHLPMPRRDILKNEYYGWGGIQTSRGCPMNCSFCSVSAFNGRRFRRRPLEAVIEELEQIPQTNVMITDDNIIGYSQADKEWARVFFARIAAKRIKKNFFVQASIQFGDDPELIQTAARGGVKILFIGLESVQPETLRSYQKGLNLKRLEKNNYHELIARIRRAGIAVIGAFVVGGDEEDISIFQATLNFIQSSHIDVLQITKPTPLPGTQLWHRLSTEGRIINQDFPKAWEEYRLTKMVYKPTKMSIEDVYEGFTYLREIYYGFWQTLKRTLNTLLTTQNLVTTIIAYKFNASFRRGYLTSAHREVYNRPELKRKFNPIDQLQGRP